jgi:hypothetical protein
MKKSDLAELFTKAAIIDRRLPIMAKPAALRAQQIPYVHDEADQRGWFPVAGRTKSERIANRKKLKCSLQEGDIGRYAEERMKMLDPDHQRILPEDVTDWETVNEYLWLVTDEDNRKALLNWAKAKAGGRPFKHWCKKNGIHEETGRRRKDRALGVISAHLIRIKSQNDAIDVLALLPTPPFFEHISDNISRHIEEPKPGTWMDDLAFSPVEHPEVRDFSWAEKRNEARRQRERKRREQQAA